ncbi:MAG TPA: ATP-binding protein [Rhizomicrobium sp.]|jgi:two-component system OmpR family sensor kinase|nr:ATP-binding protein [Rhizomicrobium sp.]
MRRPLFWKIFFGICFTCFVVSQIVWLTYAILSPAPSETTRALARITLAAARQSIEIGGEQALARQIGSWPSDERGHIHYRLLGPAKADQPDPEHGLFATSAVDPRGNRYAITYHVTRFAGYGHGPFDVPMRTFLFVLGGILVFSIITTWYLTVPIRRLRAAFGRLAAGELKARLGRAFQNRRDEISDLAGDFDKMAGRLEELVASRDRLLADVSHELRSPLARLQLAIALARQAPEKTSHSLSRIEKEADRLEEMVAELLTLSKLESGGATATEYFYLGEIVALVSDDARFEAQQKGVEIVLAPVPRGMREPILCGNGKLVSRALENVVRNATRFSRQGQTVTIALDCNDTGAGVVVTDQGPGVKAEKLNTVFEPFVQAEAANGQGYGLGLTIAQRAIKAHGGTIAARNGTEKGLVVSIWLPAAAGVSGAAEKEEISPVFEHGEAPVAL